MSFEPGDVTGDYQIIGVLGTGGMGQVFRVRNLISDREEAMKVVLPAVTLDPGSMDRFLREIKVQASLVHPNIASLHTAVRSGDRILMILELIEGESLQQRIRRAPVSWQETVHYMAQTLSGLGFAHSKGVVHRDVKPGNIMLAIDGTAKITDFGIARAANSRVLTSTGQAVGSLLYMSPEQIRAEAPDGRSDIYSTGVTMYEALTSVKPFEGDSDWVILNCHLNVDPVPPIQLNPSCPQIVSDVVLKAMQKNPADRFQTAEEFRNALNACNGYWTPEQTSAQPVSAEIEPEPDPVAMRTVQIELAKIVGPIAASLVREVTKRFRTTAEIYRELALHVPEGAARIAFLRGCGAQGKQTPVPAPDSSNSFSPADLEKAQRALTPLVGPISRLMVERTAKKVGSVADLWEALARQIPDDQNRKRFLASAPG
ncbi:MAG: serine/threonine protein kinase [Bryobacteraceae bacterium]|nr:serine/threonine protein kinase [Bryobacteraceae bacterium]